jgi:hypothetical protein
MVETGRSVIGCTPHLRDRGSMTCARSLDFPEGSSGAPWRWARVVLDRWGAPAQHGLRIRARTRAASHLMEVEQCC